MEKRSSTVAVLAITAVTSFAQAPPWNWARREGGPISEYATGVATDAGGNVYITGWFQSATITFGTTTLTRVGGDGDDDADDVNEWDVYLVKYDPSGNVVWARGAGGQSNDAANGIAVDPSGNVIITGYFFGPSCAFGTHTVYNSGGNNYTEDAFITKYDPDGNVLWARNAGGNTIDIGKAVATDAAGNVYVVGRFQSSVILVGTISLNNAGGMFNPSDMFIAKYDPDGHVIWARSAGGHGDDRGNSIAVAADGHLYVVGAFTSDTLSIASDMLINSSTPGWGFNDVFIARYDTAGNALWARQGAGHNDDYGSGITTDSNGDAYCTGTFASTKLGLEGDSLVNGGVFDAFIAKFDPSGALIWARNPNGNDQDYGAGITTDVLGDVYLTGRFQSPVIAFGTVTLANTGSSDVYLAKNTPDGDAIWAARATGIVDAESTGVSADEQGHVYITGDYATTPIVFDSYILANAGGEDIFTARLDGNTSLGAGNVSPRVDQLLIWPVPANERSTVSLPPGARSVRILDAMGRVVRSESIAGKTVFELRIGIRGTYVLEVITDKEAMTKRFVVSE